MQNLKYYPTKQSYAYDQLVCPETTSSKSRDAQEFRLSVMCGQQSTSGRADGTPVKLNWESEYDPVGHALHDDIPAREFYICHEMVMTQDETL
jgi:hypothetical protein